MTIQIPSPHKPEYGSVEWYENMFSDIIGDAGNSDSLEENKEAIKNILDGFEAAIKSWLRYHSHCVDTYRYMLKEYKD